MPSPATVVIVPFGATLRMRFVGRSAIRMLPSGIGATSNGKFSAAAVADPPSPENVAVPVPAKVSMNPLAGCGRGGSGQGQEPGGDGRQQDTGERWGPHGSTG